MDIYKMLTEMNATESVRAGTVGESVEDFYGSLSDPGAILWFLYRRALPNRAGETERNRVTGLLLPEVLSYVDALDKGDVQDEAKKVLDFLAASVAGTLDILDWPIFKGMTAIGSPKPSKDASDYETYVCRAVQNLLKIHDVPQSSVAAACGEQIALCLGKATVAKDKGTEKAARKALLTRLKKTLSYADAGEAQAATDGVNLWADDQIS